MGREANADSAMRKGNPAMKILINVRREIRVDDLDQSLCDPYCRYFDIAPERCTLYYLNLENRKRCDQCKETTEKKND